MLDLDLTVSEPKKFRFKGTVYAVKEPTVEQLMKHSQLVDQLTDLRKKLDKLEAENKKDQNEYDDMITKYRHINRTFDKTVIDIFVPDFSNNYTKLTAIQRDRLIALILDIDEKKTEQEAQVSGVT